MNRGAKTACSEPANRSARRITRCGAPPPGPRGPHAGLEWLPGAEEGTRTPTPLRVHGPEPCASANSATTAALFQGSVASDFALALCSRWEALAPCSPLNSKAPSQRLRPRTLLALGRARSVLTLDFQVYV